MIDVTGGVCITSVHAYVLLLVSKHDRHEHCVQRLCMATMVGV